MSVNTRQSFRRYLCDKERSRIIVKHKELTTEIQHKWNVKAKEIRVLTRADGNLSKSFSKYLSHIPGEHEVKKLHQTAVLGTAHLLRKVTI
jgi:hypothetical protein